MLQPGRQYSAAGGYRYGFNGKENDNEVSGQGNNLDFGVRIYDSRLGRWLSVDPLQKKYAGFSPYQFVENNPVTYIDIDGQDRWLFFTIIDERNGENISFAVKVSAELLMEVETSPLGKVYDRRNYYDISLNYNITINADGKVNATLTESRGSFRTSVRRGFSMGDDEKAARRNIWWSDLFTINTYKDDDIGSGYFLSSSNGEGLGDPFGPGAKKVDVIDNADAFLAMAGGAGAFEAKNASEILKRSKAESVVAFFESLAKSLEAGEKIGFAVELAKEKMTPDPNTVHCLTCANGGNEGNFLLDSNGNVTRTESNKAASDTVNHHEPPVRKKTLNPEKGKAPSKKVTK